MRRLGGAIAAALALALLSTPATSATLAGTKCAPAGKQRVVNGATFVCKRVAGRLVWKRIPRKAAAPVPSPRASTPAAPPRVISADDPRISSTGVLAGPGRCRTTDRTPYGGGTSGFPRPAYALTGVGQYRILVLPFATADFQPGAREVAALEQAAKESAAFFQRVSFGQLTLTFEFLPERLWPRLPGKADDYSLISKKPQQNNTDMVTRIFADASAEIDFDAYHAVVLESAYWPQSGGGQGFPGVRFPAPTGTATGVNLHFGNAVHRSSVITHELGHSLFALEDLYIFLNPQRPSVPVPTPLYAWDIMSGDGAADRDFSAWNKYLIGWLPDDRVRCLQSPTVTTGHYLASSQSATTSPQMLAINLEPGVTLVVEARKQYAADARVRALVYLVDTRISHGDGPIRSEQELLAVGGTVVRDGYRIAVIDADANALLVEVSPA